MSTLINNLSITALMATAAVTTAFAGKPDYDLIAKNLVNESIGVRPGEIVQIAGTQDQIELMAAIQVAVSKAGGESVVTLTLPHANKRALMETPMKHLERTQTGPVLFTRMFDALINVSSVQDPALFADVPEERLAATRRAAAPINHVFKNANFRSVSLGQTGGIPTESYAKSIKANYKELDDMFWQALEVSPQQINEAAVIVTGMMSPGIDVHITSKAGTDLRFRVGNDGARLNAGRTADVKVSAGPRQVWLPAGEAYTTIIPGSAKGTLFVERTRFRGKEIENLKLVFDDGKLTGIDGKNVDLLKEFFASSDDATSMPSVLDIGLNPSSQKPRNTHHYSWEMGGMVSLQLGNNAWAGGDNNADGGFAVHVPEATVDAGGQRLTSAGVLPKQVVAVFRGKDQAAK